MGGDDKNTSLANLPKKAKAVYRLMKSVGPTVLAFSDSLSEKYSKNQIKIANSDAAKAYIIEEVNRYLILANNYSKCCQLRLVGRG